MVSQRYLKGSIMLTTNYGIPSWGEIFGDNPVVAAAKCWTACCIGPPS